MLDIKFIRSNPEMVKQAMKNRNMDFDASIDRLVGIDAERRDIMAKVEALRAEQNAASKEIPRIRKQGGDIQGIMARMKGISEQVKELEGRLAALETEQRDSLLTIPNIPHESVPVGKDSDDNVEIRRFMEPTKFDFEPKPHWEIGTNLGILDPETAAKVTGARFHFYKGAGAALERAIVNFFLDTHTKHGYTEVFPPFMVNRASMTGTGQLPKFEQDAFKVEGADYFLIPTAEVPVTNIHRDEILDGAKLPINYCAYSACFRAEAGSAGRDTRGLIRQHQFNKVELVKFADPDDSYRQLEKLTGDAERVLQLLKLPYRVVALCSGDLGFSSAKTYDIEVWMPSYNKYVEISSCSNFEIISAAPQSVLKGYERQSEAGTHLNGSGVAVGRTVAAILENCQYADGSITVPEVLRPYMGIDEIRA